MLLRRTETSTVGISQPRHAWLAGELARSWGNETFQSPEPRDVTILAAAIHDIGWLDWEQNPQCNVETGLPIEFFDVPAEVHTQLWRNGVDRARTYGDHVALIVSRHGDAIYDRTFDPATARAAAAAAVQAFRAEQAKLQRELVDRIAANPIMAAFVTPGYLDFSKRFLVAVDTLSLKLCWGVEDPVEISDVPISPTEATNIVLASGDSGEVLVDPWPFGLRDISVSIQGVTLATRTTPLARRPTLQIHTLLKPA